MGEMETMCMMAHGSMEFLREKFQKDSDGYDSFVCKTCGSTDIIFNPD